MIPHAFKINKMLQYQRTFAKLQCNLIHQVVLFFNAIVAIRGGHVVMTAKFCCKALDAKLSKKRKNGNVIKTRFFLCKKY
jgi:hypothetical protein